MAEEAKRDVYWWRETVFYMIIVLREGNQA